LKRRGVLLFLLRESAGARGRLAFFSGSIAIGVAAVVAVAALSGAMADGMRGQSRQLMAADIKLEAHQPIVLDLGALPGARATQVRELATMAGRLGPAGTVAASRLVELKVLQGPYPYYGELGLGGANGRDPALTLDALLAPDAVVVAPELGQGLGLALGDQLRLGGANFRIAGWVLEEPDRMGFSLTLGPRVFLSQAGLERTDLLGALNRVRYSTLVALPESLGPVALTRVAEGLAADAGGEVEARTHFEAQPNVRRGLERFGSFLGLVALLSLVLGGLGVAEIMRSWMASKRLGIAVWRTLGLRPREILSLHLLHALSFALLGSLLGALVGGSLPFLLSHWAPDLISPELIRAWQPLAMLRGVGLGVGVAAIFALPALVSGWRVPPSLVLRSDMESLRAPRRVRFGAWGVLFVGLFLAAWLQAGRADYALGFSFGLLILATALALGAKLLMALAARLPRGRIGPLLTYGVAALARPGAGTMGSIVALGLGSMVVVSMGLIENGLAAELKGALPENAPSVFLVDVQKSQWDAVEALLQREGAERCEMVPVIMARYGGTRVLGDPDEPKSKAAWATTREQRLTYLDELPASNTLVAGSWWSDPEHFEVSMEQGYAESLGVELGELVQFRIQGVPFEFRLTSLRAIRWESFEINFFIVVEPGALEDAPQFRLAAASLEAGAEDRVQNELVERFPNITMLRIRPIIERVAALMTRIALGVRLLGGFTILAGSVGASQSRRGREVALLKTLGQRRFEVRRMFAVEFALGGLVAGLLGALGGFGLAYAFLRGVLEFDVQLPWWWLGPLVLGVALLAVLAGLAASRRSLAAAPLESLRG